MAIHLVRSVIRAGAVCAAFAAPCARLHAADGYVDAAQGSDANDGAAPSTAWRTITHAIAAIAALPNAAQTIHVAAGLYDTAHGEVFPLQPPPRTRISGIAGSAQTIVAGPASTLLSWFPHPMLPVDAESGASGLTLRSATTAISVGAANGDASPSFEDIRVEGTSGPGISVTASSAGPFGGASAFATFVRLDVLQCDVGVVVAASGGGLGSGGAGVEITDGAIRASTQEGVRYQAFGNAGARVRLHRSRVVDNGGHGAWGSVGGGVTSAWLIADATLFAGNALCGVFGDGATQGESGQFYLDDCTVADNADCGVRGLNGNQANLRNCVLARNGDDLDVAAPNTFASFTDCANGDLAGFSDCIAADPLFLDPAQRDYRLRFGSACADRGDPISAGALDLLGRARPFDGDLDTIEVPDMGALELAPLALAGVPHFGTTVALEVTGPAGAPATVYACRGPLLAAPAHTPFGALWLTRASIAVHAQTAAQPGPRAFVPVTLPGYPSWIGQTIAFQARIASSAAPAGAALSNTVAVVVLP